jgi:hypothetical protein
LNIVNIYNIYLINHTILGICQPGSNKPADTPSGAGPSQAQVHMEDDNLFDLKPNVPVSMT